MMRKPLVALAIAAALAGCSRDPEPAPASPAPAPPVSVEPAPVAAPEPAPESASWPEEELRGLAMRGRLLFPDGRPCADLALQFGFVVPGSPITLDATTDEQGRFGFVTTIPDACNRLWLTAEAGGVPVTRDAALAPDESALDWGDIVVVLGVTVRGRVEWGASALDPEPWRVVLFPAGPAVPGVVRSSLPPCALDESAHFERGGVPPGPLSATLVHPLLGAVDEVRGEAADGGVLELVLRYSGADPRTCIVVLVRRDEPVPESWITLLGPDGSTRPPTRAHGNTFVFEGLPDGRYGARIEFPGGQRFEETDIARGTRRTLQLTKEEQR